MPSNPHDFHTPQPSYSRDELLRSSDGGYFGPGNAQLPAPPMLMMDRITEISLDGGAFGKGHIVGELDIAPGHWFFGCHYHSDATMPGSLGLDAMWQMIGYWLGWSGSPGKGRAIWRRRSGCHGLRHAGDTLRALRGRHAHGPARQAGARNCRWPRARRRRQCFHGEGYEGWPDQGGGLSLIPLNWRACEPGRRCSPS